ncbi:hypothetical protein BH09SUM1_BH09SUM1_17650 [soil metagenome]
MPWNQYVLGYHGCDAAVVKRVINGEEPLKPSENEYDWLGHGQYFWEENPGRAMAWAEESARLKASAIQRPAILGAVINLGRCLNLTNSGSLELVSQGYAHLQNTLRATGKPMPTNVGKGHRMRRLDCAVIETIHKVNIDQKLPAFDTVRAFFIEGEPLYPKAGFRRLDHVQICVRNPQMIEGYFLPRIK